MDWNLACHGGEVEPKWSPDQCTRLWWQRGGAALLSDLVEATVGMITQTMRAEVTILQPGTPRDPVPHADPRFHHSYALWSQYPSDDGAIWRVRSFLGLDACQLGADPSWRRVVADTSDMDLVILDDANLGFRDAHEEWPAAIQINKQDPWVLVKASSPVAQGPLWDHLLEHHADRLIVVTTIDDLRLSEVQISRQLSWERTAQDLFWELTHNPRVNGFARCKHAIVTFGPSGAFLISRSEERAHQAQIIFDPTRMEGDWARSYPGGMIGYTSCMIGSVAFQLITNPDAADLPLGIQRGIAAARSLHRSGYGIPDSSPIEAELRFPMARISQEYAKTEIPFAQAEVQNPVQYLKYPPDPHKPRVMEGYWTILEDMYPGSLREVAQRIVLEGYERALENVPLGKFGALVTVDRREIEALHSIRTLINEYCDRPQKRPLSIAVFGPPGSGKSFGVTQIAKSARPEDILTLSFNLSQFEAPDELLDALHQVRDIGLAGKIPLVFWDEFDTELNGRRLGWLRHFLAPMQDGSFQEGQITHPIGGAIFVFAGGTSHRLESFGSDLEQAEQRAVKLPDFISRLKGFLNVLGPNPIEGENDPYFIIRRAIILRVLFQLNAPQILQDEDGISKVKIDRGILRAFLETQTYKHGVRSIESIIAMSTLAGASSFERSNLPSEEQLNLHVEGLDFLSRVQQIDLEGELLERLAGAAHNVFCAELERQGYSYGAETNDEMKTHNALRPYTELSDELKQFNRNNVRDIPNKLSATGYVMIPARSNEPPFDFPGDDLERLAKIEHERWRSERLASGWTYAEMTDKENKSHAALVDWKDLHEDEKEKDRELIRKIPKILSIAGYAIVKS